MLTHPAQRSGAAVLALAAGLIGAPVAAADDSVRPRQEASVTMTDLGVLGRGARAHQITDSGVVIGSFTTEHASRAFRWVDGVMTDLPDLGGPNTNVADVNERGQAVGSSNTHGSESHAVLWQPDGTVVDLRTPGIFSEATGINRLGVVAGQFVTSDFTPHVVTWRDGVMTELGHLGGGWSNTFAHPTINDLGQVVGTSLDTAGIEHAFRWDDGIMSALPPLLDGEGSFARGINRRGDVLGSAGNGVQAIVWDDDGAHEIPHLGGEFPLVVAIDINDRGQVVGSAQTSDGGIHAIVATRDTVVDLGTLGGLNSGANAVNRRGQVVGGSDVGPDPFEHHAVLWDRGQMIDLGTLGGGFSQALDINRRGQIVGYSVDADGVEHAVMWTIDRTR